MTTNSPIAPDDTAFAVDVPAGRFGVWEIRYDAGHPELWQGDTVWMAVVPDEIEDHREFVELARGRVLISGLGLGMVLQAVAAKPEVSHVTVLEQQPAVLALVAPHYRARFGERVEILEADARTWRPPDGVVFDHAWHDIWPWVDPRFVGDMDAVLAHHAPWCRWQGAWSRDRFI